MGNQYCVSKIVHIGLVIQFCENTNFIQSRLMTFSELGVGAEVLQAITDLGFERPMPVQEAVLPILLNSETDLIALAQTGTGKTAAFGIPTIQNLDYSNKNTEAVVLSPTRELCVQIANDLSNYAKYIPECTVVPVYGGASVELQRKALKKGAKIIVATPGRINDLLRRKYIDLSHVRWAVLDEADEMLDMGFKDDLDFILSQTPEDKHTMLFSATMPDEVARIAANYMHNPQEVTIGIRNSGSANVRHCYYLVQAKDRYLALKRIADYYPSIYAIIFCRTRSETQEVASALIRDGYNADALHGDLSQAQRDHVMERFRCRNLQMLVATDVAARGLDVSDLTHVINYNLPDEIEQYTHRSGRTGRADKTGISIAIINLRERHKIKAIEKIINKKFEQVSVPTGMDVCEKQFYNMIAKVEKVEVNYDEINKFVGEVVKRLEWMDKKELISRFVSVEFNRFLEYYRNSPDLNVAEREEKAKIEKKKSKVKHNDVGMARLFFNLGYEDKILPQRLIGLINDTCDNKDIKIGKIDILERFSYVDVDGMYANEIIGAFHGETYKRKPLIVEAANAKKAGNDKKGRGKRNRQDDKAFAKEARNRRDAASPKKKAKGENFAEKRSKKKRRREQNK